MTGLDARTDSLENMDEFLLADPVLALRVESLGADLVQRQEQIGLIVDYKSSDNFVGVAREVLDEDAQQQVAFKPDALVVSAQTDHDFFESFLDEPNPTGCEM